MDSENEDVLQLGIGGHDIEGMELDDPISAPSRWEAGDRDEQELTDDSRGRVNRGALDEEKKGGVVPIVGPVRRKAGKSAKKKKWRSKNPTVLERRRLRKKEKKKIWKQKAKEALKVRVAAATRGSSADEPVPGLSSKGVEDAVRHRVYYDELLPSSIGTYYHPRPAPLVRNLLPAGYYSDHEEDTFEAEALLEPEERPWMKGHKKPLALPQVVVEPQRDAEGVVLVERARQRYYESPSTKLARYAIRSGWKMAEREILLKESREIKFPRQQMPNITVGDFRNTLRDPARVHQDESR
jgi:hypothetical protein